MNNINYNEESFIGLNYILRGEVTPIKINNELVIYKGESANNIFLKTIEKTDPKTYATLKFCLENNIIIPCFSDRSVLDKLNNTFKVDLFKYKTVLGIFSTEFNKIFIILDNRIDFGFFINDSAIVSTSLHELGHYSFYNSKQNILSYYNLRLQKFYRKFVEEYFNVNRSNFIDEYSNELYKRILNFEVTLDKKEYNKLNNIYKDIILQIKDIKNFDKILNKSENELKNKSNQLISLMENLINKNQFDNNYRFFHECMFKSYNYINVKDVDYNTFFYQELIYPSEIFSVNMGSDYSDRMFNIIKRNLN